MYITTKDTWSNGDDGRARGQEMMEENRGNPFDRTTIPRDGYDYDNDDDDIPPRPLNYHRSIDNCYVLCPRDGQEVRAASFYIESVEFANELNQGLNRLCPPHREQPPRRASKISRQGRSNSVAADQRRRSSVVQSNRSRANSCGSGRPTPLGNGRRGSSSRRTKVRRASSTRRKDSVRPLKTVVKEAQKIVEDERSLEQARRHRRITMIIVGTFIFLLVASVLVVVVTLTHSTFLSPPMGSKELAEHRAQTAQRKRGAVEFPQQSLRN